MIPYSFWVESVAGITENSCFENLRKITGKHPEQSPSLNKTMQNESSENYLSGVSNNFFQNTSAWIAETVRTLKLGVS